MPPAELFYSFLLTQIFTSLFESSAVNEEADEKKVSLLPKATQKINEEDLQKKLLHKTIFTIYHIHVRGKAGLIFLYCAIVVISLHYSRIERIYMAWF